MLTQQDQTDLLGLVSGLGSPESDDRARELAARDQEAARFIEQLRGLTACLEAPAESECEHLDSAAIERISTAAYTRWRRRRMRRAIGYLAAAACVVLFGFGSLRVYRDAVARQTSTMRFELGANLGGNDRFWNKPELVLGQPLSTNADHVLVRLGKNRAVLNTLSTAVFSESGVELRDGEVMIEVKDRFSFQAGPVQGELDSGKALISFGPEETHLRLFEGSVRAQTSSGPVSIKPRQEAIWKNADNGRLLGVVESRASIPYWAAQGFERDDLRPR